MISEIRSGQKKGSGQVTLEYFILFAVVAVTVIVGYGAFGGGIKTALESFLNARAAAMWFECQPPRQCP